MPIWVCSWCVRDGAVPDIKDERRTDGVCGLHEELVRMDWGLEPWERQCDSRRVA